MDFSDTAAPSRSIGAVRHTTAVYAQHYRVLHYVFRNIPARDECMRSFVLFRRTRPSISLFGVHPCPHRYHFACKQSNKNVCARDRDRNGVQPSMDVGSTQQVCNTGDSKGWRDDVNRIGQHESDCFVLAERSKIMPTYNAM